jgi:hypothetical protein
MFYTPPHMPLVTVCINNLRTFLSQLVFASTLISKRKGIIVHIQLYIAPEFLANKQSARLSVQSSELGPSTPHPQASVALPLVLGGRHTRLRGGGGGGTQFGRLDRKPGTLYILSFTVKSEKDQKTFEKNCLMPCIDEKINICQNI